MPKRREERGSVEIKTGQLIVVEGYGFMFGRDNNTGEIKCFSIEQNI